MSYIGKTPTIGNFQVCDAISVVNNQAAYTMQVSSVNVSPESANHMIVSLNGVIQKPTDAFTVSASVITFASNLVTGDVIDFIQILGNVLDLGVPSDNTVTTAKIADGAVTSAKLASDSVTYEKIGYNANPYRNIIINGDMSIAQRGTSATGLGNGDNGYHTCDRWKFTEVGAATAEFTQTQSTDVPTGQGFATSLKMDCTTADTSLASNEIFRIQQHIEGQNLQYLKKGTANAESLTLSFWVKSNKTGIYTVYFYDNDNTRLNSKSYTIDSASTWEKKTITIAGDTTGAFDNNNALSLLLSFQLLAGTDYTSGTLQDWGTSVTANFAPGQVNLADSTSNDFYITGVQLEAGTSASDFEFLPVDVNLQRCLRYYQVFIDGNTQVLGFGNYYAANNLRTFGEFLTPMRAVPSLEVSDVTDNFRFLRDSASDYVNDFILNSNTTTRIWGLINTADASGAANLTGYIQSNSTDSYLAFDGEL